MNYMNDWAPLINMALLRLRPDPSKEQADIARSLRGRIPHHHVAQPLLDRLQKDLRSENVRK